MHTKIKLARDASWDVRVLWTLNICWDVIADALESGDYDGIRGALDELSELRSDQEKCEAELLNDAPKKDRVTVALRLIALYHWIKSTELTARIILGHINSSTGEINHHFDKAIDAAKSAGDVDLTTGLRILKAAARSIAAAHEMS